MYYYFVFLNLDPKIANAAVPVTKNVDLVNVSEKKVAHRKNGHLYAGGHDRRSEGKIIELIFIITKYKFLYVSSRRRSISPRPFRRGRTPPNGLGDRTPPEDLDPEERDARTVFCMQLSQRIRARDLEEFFSSVGKVRDVRLITCNKTKRFKGIAYIEFKDPESVPLVS